MLKFNRQAEKSETAAAGYSVLDAHIVVHGDIQTEGTLRIDGRLEGNVLRASSVIIGGTGSIVGDVRAAEMVICGSVTGNIEVDRRVELEATGTVIGDLTADAILVHEGGTVRGRLLVRSQAAAPPDVEAHPGFRIPTAAASEA